jgi:site-specific recombinase XerD
MKLPESWPYRIERGNVRLTIYRHENKGYAEFKLAYYDSTGKRRLQTFSDFTDAVKRANEVRTSINKGEADVLTLTSNDRLTYLRALDAIKGTGMALDIAAHQFADAVKRLNGRSIGEAVDFFMKRLPGRLPDKTVSDGVRELLTFTKQNGASSVYLKDLDFRLSKFADTFHCQLASVTATEINAFLRRLDCAPRGRTNYKGAIRTLFRFAAKEKWVPRDHVDWLDVDTIKNGVSQIEIFKPDEMVKLLKAAQLDAADLAPGFNIRYATGQGLLPLLVLGGFAGLRTAEIQRQLWSDINLERGFIRVTAAKGNTAQKRLVPISLNLRSWLQICNQTCETCCEYPRPNEATARLAKRAGIEWKHNGLRHSFISYRVAETQDVAKVSLEAGNSPKMIFRHYRELVTPDEARAWFAISPEPAQNVVPIPRTAAVE